MALVAMAVHNVPDSGRLEMTRRTLESLAETVDWDRHRLFICDNGSAPDTQALYRELKDVLLPFEVIGNNKNIGTANAINRAWALRTSNEACVKMDNDVLIHEKGWLDLALKVFAASDYQVGICALKRKDLAEWPDSDNEWYKSKIIALPHQPGERWLIVEEVAHAMGTCQVYSPMLLHKMGYLYQMGGLYGFDDSLACLRARLLGFKVVFLPHIHIEHIDAGNTEYTDWKREYAGEKLKGYHAVAEDYMQGRRSTYYDGGKYVK